MLNAADLFADGQQIMRLNERVIGEVSREYGMSRRELEVLLFLAENPGLDTAKEIVESRAMTKSCVSKVVDSLVRQGYLRTREDETDRRIIHLVIEEKAGEVIRSGMAGQEWMQEVLCRGVTREELLIFQCTIEKIRENVREVFKGETTPGKRQVFQDPQDHE